MSKKLPIRRFWTRADVAQEEGGFGVRLDDRPLRTPAKAPLLSPTRALAEAIAAEWNVDAAEIDPKEMGLTRYANSAIDRVAPHFEQIVDQVAAYGGSDLLCYRSAHPAPLVTREAAAWDPLLDWLDERYGVRLILVEGLVHAAQPAAMLLRLREAVATCDPFALSALHELTAISGSLGIGLAVVEGRLEAAEAFRISRVGEDWQAEQWGQDDLAIAAAEIKRVDFIEAARFHALARI